MQHFFSPNSGEDQKKRSSPKMEHFFSSNSSGDLRSDAHQSQIIGGDADVDHTQIIGGYIPTSPPGFGTPDIYYKLRIRGGGYSVLVNYQSFFKFLFISLPQLFFSINCIRNRLLRVSFIELLDFIIYQHLNMRTKILLLATSQIAHLCNEFIQVCSANF